MATRGIVVTGGASFIGSHLVEKLVSVGHDVHVIDDLSSGKMEFLDNVVDKISYTRFDIRENPKLVREIFTNKDTVFHLANMHGGRNWIHYHPAQCCENMAVDNIVFENAVKAGVKHVQFCSSACVYPLSWQASDGWQFLQEKFVDYNNLQSADEEYGLAKLMGEVSLRAHNSEFDLKGSIVRLSSIYGPRENETHAVIALIAKAFVRQEPYEIFGDGSQVRNFTYVEDVIECMTRAAERINDCTPVNLGTMECITINEFVEMIFDEMRWKPKEIFRDKSKPTGAHSRVVDNSLAAKLLGFGQEQWTSIRDGLKRTIDWYVSTHDRSYVAENLQMLLSERSVSSSPYLIAHQVN